jgi:methionine synthase I (cobalamin-dependent)
MTGNNILHKALREKRVLLADGATGTNLFDRGLESGAAPELWNGGSPEQISKVKSLHREFVDAGADIILTNTFGANRARLALHGAHQHTAEINCVAANLARDAVKYSERNVLIAGSVGPTGELFAPLGALSYEEGVSIFEEQGAGLAGGGVDVFWIETMSSWDELNAAIAGVSRFNIPIVATASFDTAGHTMMGIGPADFFDGIAGRIEAFGANCGTGPKEALQVLKGMKDRELLVKCLNTEVLDAGEFLDNKTHMVIKANCGVPVFEGAQAVYQGTPELMSAYTAMAAQMGASIIGGCCGTTPEHIRVMRQALDLYLAVTAEAEAKIEKVRTRRRS